jgi:3D (Asp-Asp-Asp) domain-containing protein
MIRGIMAFVLAASMITTAYTGTMPEETADIQKEPVEVAVFTEPEVVFEKKEVEVVEEPIQQPEPEPVQEPVQETPQAPAQEPEPENSVTEPSPVLEYMGTCWVTGYDHCATCCGKAGQPTASGVWPEVGRTVAMCSNYPFGTKIYIQGLGYYTVEDRGVKGDGKVDIFCNNHSECYALTGWYEVYEVIE